MAIRITGMYSGLDTEAIISELVSAQSVKKSKYVKEQTKLSWKMDAWKALNTKIYNFYTNTLDNMRFQASYLKKAAKVSNSSALSVVLGSNAVNGSQTVSVDRLATTAKLTGTELGKNIKSSTKLSALGIEGDASFEVNVGGKKTTISVNGDMKISDVVTKLQKAGLNASFDDDNHRFFISSKESGAAADFTITAGNQAGFDVLNALGLVAKEDLEKNREYYEKWADYRNGDGTATDAYKQLIADEVNKRADSYKKANDDLKAKNDALEEEIEKLKENKDYKKAKEDDAEATADSLYKELYGATDEEGTRSVGLKEKLDNAKAELAKAQADLKAAQEDEDFDGDLDSLKAAVDDAQAEVDDAQAAFDEKNAQYTAVKAVEDKQAQIDANNAEIEKNQQYYSVDLTVDDEGGTVESVVGSDILQAAVTKEFDGIVEYAKGVLASIDGKSEENGKYASRIAGEDAQITVDGATFTSSTNDFTVNGMSITVYEKAENVTITTSADVDGIYDMIKNFFTEYNSLINEMSALYNADSSKGYDPLTSEEKAEMADSEIEEWEKKIKDSLLRRDDTLGDLMDSIKTVMLQGATVNGKKMYLSDFGINTLGYWNSGENEKSAYHINGDPDDSNVKDENDMLRRMISSDPDTVMNFFSGIMNNLYDKLSDKMTSIKDTRSMFTVYNDKAMQKEYDNYKDKIAKEEEKLNSLMDKWYEKFSKMETALAKLQSKSNGLGNMLGGS